MAVVVDVDVVVELVDDVPVAVPVPPSLTFVGELHANAVPSKSRIFSQFRISISWN
jgi:hypothetical protein